MARYHYYTQVVFHRTRMGYDAVFKKYLQENFAEESKKLLKDEVEIDFWNDFDDYYVFQQIKKDCARGNLWAKILLRIDHLKPVFSTGSHATEQELYRSKEIQYKLKKKFKKGKDFFVVIRKKDIHSLEQTTDEEKEANSKEGNNAHLVINDRGEVTGKLTENSSLLARFTDPIKIIRIYAVPNKYDAVCKVVKDINKEQKKIVNQKF